MGVTYQAVRRFNSFYPKNLLDHSKFKNTYRAYNTREYPYVPVQGNNIESPIHLHRGYTYRELTTRKALYAQ